MEMIHKCPVCDGKGLVPYNFYGSVFDTTLISPIQCRGCKGSGVFCHKHDYQKKYIGSLDELEYRVFECTTCGDIKIINRTPL